MIDFYTWITPNGRKISIFLEELDVEYTCHVIDITKNEQFSDNYILINPLGKIPAIVDHDTGRTIIESGAIMIYLAEKFGKFLPQAGPERDEVIQWLFWQTASFGPILGQAHHFLYYFPDASAYSANRYREEALRLYSDLDRRLIRRDFVAGDYSIADMAIWPWVSRFEWQQIDLASFENVDRWYESIAGRPQVQRGYHQPFVVQNIPYSH